MQTSYLTQGELTFLNSFFLCKKDKNEHTHTQNGILFLTQPNDHHPVKQAAEQQIFEPSQVKCTVDQPKFLFCATLVGTVLNLNIPQIVYSSEDYCRYRLTTATTTTTTTVLHRHGKNRIFHRPLLLAVLQHPLFPPFHPSTHTHPSMVGDCLFVLL